MNFDQRQEVYSRLEEQNGKDNQIIKTIEEMSELIKELTKLLGKDTYTSNKNICEEIADAKICIEQIERFLQVKPKMIESIMDYKLERLVMFYIHDKPTPIESFVDAESGKEVYYKIDRPRIEPTFESTEHKSDVYYDIDELEKAAINSVTPEKKSWLKPIIKPVIDD